VLSVSLVVPIFNEEVILARLHAETVPVLAALGEPYEIVYVNDGSHDGSLEILLGFQAADSQVVVVDLSRNWGHQAAITAGLSVARGDAVILMDGDLQDPPAVIPELIRTWHDGAQVVIAERRSRQERGLRGALFHLFYRLLGYLSDYPIPLNAGIFGLLDRRVVNVINRLSENNRYLPGLRSWIGFKTAFVQYERQERAGGVPKQTLFRLIKYGLDAIFSFSYKPLRLSMVLGLLTGLFAVLFGVVLITCRTFGIGLFGQPIVAGYTSTIVSILFLSGVQLFCVGLLGEYIGRVYDEVKRRPLFVVHQIHQQLDPDQPE
jgi:dolichol-phosphate mannosyltransferase